MSLVLSRIVKSDVNTSSDLENDKSYFYFQFYRFFKNIYLLLVEEIGWKLIRTEALLPP